MAKCSIDGCSRPLQARGWCAAHYAKWKKYGDPLVVKQAQMHGVSLLERFVANVKVGPLCWEWASFKDPKGYGRISINEVPILAHRLSYEFTHGVKLTPDQHVMHTCDNPGCVRPSHLQLGDQAANMADKMKKGRHVYGTSKGEAHGGAKLTEAVVRDIRASADTGVALAARYGISTTQVSDIRRRRVWRHLD